MSFDVSKLTPRPWEATGLESDRGFCDVMCVLVEKKKYYCIGRDINKEDAKFIIDARQAFDIQMQMEWGVNCHQDDGWYAIDGSGDRVYIIIGRKNSYPIHEWSPAHHNNPVEAILKTWEWYQANKHREVT